MFECDPLGIVFNEPCFGGDMVHENLGMVVVTAGIDADPDGFHSSHFNFRFPNACLHDPD
jgi:hypothetical protein